LLRVIKAIPLLRVNFGRVYVEISDPIFLNTYIKKRRAEDKLKPIDPKMKPVPISKQLGL